MTKRCDACIDLARATGIEAVAWLIIMLLFYSQSGALIFLLAGIIGTVAFFLIAMAIYKHNPHCPHAVETVEV